MKKIDVNNSSKNVFLISGVLIGIILVFLFVSYVFPKSITGFDVNDDSKDDIEVTDVEAYCTPYTSDGINLPEGTSGESRCIMWQGQKSVAKCGPMGIGIGLGNSGWSFVDACSENEACGTSTYPVTDTRPAYTFSNCVPKVECPVTSTCRSINPYDPASEPSLQWLKTCNGQHHDGQLNWKFESCSKDAYVENDVVHTGECRQLADGDAACIKISYPAVPVNPTS